MMTSFFGRNVVGLLLLILILAGCASTPPIESEPEPEMIATPAPVPEPEPEPEPELEPELVIEVVPEPVNERSYVVMQGDNLWDIAGKQAIYMNAYQWPLIFKDNKAQITDADLIYPGQVFIINLSPDEDDVNAAIEHARTRGPWSLDLIEPPDLLYLMR